MKPLTVAGMMSGTSADGIDIAVVRFPVEGALQLLAHEAFPFPRELSEAVLGAQNAEHTSTAELARLNWRLGLAYADAYRRMLALHPMEVDLVGCHGQTIYHQGVPGEYAGERFACTWQIGEMAPLAQKAGVPVISNFRPADMVAGGQGAPLVPLLDLLLYRHGTRTRVLQNIGGIGNLTVVPPTGSNAPVLAFDTGPGNMVIDFLTRKLFGQPYDDGGRLAARGRVLQPVLAEMLLEPFFLQTPPRSAGREQFGAAFAEELLRRCGEHRDAVATATALTAQSIALAVNRFVPFEGGADLIVSGGGAKNVTLLHMLREALPGVQLVQSDDGSLPTPMPVEAKEAVAFALLAYMSHQRQPGNVPSATGARAPVVLGQVTCA